MKFQLIGYPIQHSLSPWIHGEFLRKAKMEGNYTINEIKRKEDLPFQLEEMKEKGVTGFNVTAPYKQAIIPYLDELDIAAREIGAVNTVHLKSGRWIGYNTDGLGYVRSLKVKYPEEMADHSLKILLIGAGGAARGIFYALSSEGYQHIDIANRTAEKAEEIAKLGKSWTVSNVYTLEKAEQKLNQYDLIIQTTSVGMKPEADQAIFSISSLKPGTIVSDIVYQPILTRFLQMAMENKAKVHYGHTMLLYQAQLAFEIWTGITVSLDDMDEQLRRILEGR
jgi:shikimate dehydrogenase